MAESANGSVDELLGRAAAGDTAAGFSLLDRHRGRLKRMFSIRMDQKLIRRVDESDMVQETLAAAACRLPEYLAGRPMPFYPWLRKIAEQKLADAYRRHRRERRTVEREEEPPALPDRSAVELARHLISPHSSPSRSLDRREIRDQVQHALAALNEQEREVVLLYHLERMTIPEIAAVLGLTEEATKSRRRRALVRLGKLLTNLRNEWG